MPVDKETFARQCAERMAKIDAELSKSDPERAHCEADELLLTVLRQEGYGDLVDIYEATAKWFA